MKEKGSCQRCAGYTSIDTKTKTCQSCYLGMKRGRIMTEYVKRILVMKNGESRVAQSLTNAYFENMLFCKENIDTPLKFIKQEYRNYKLIDAKQNS